MTEEAQIVDLQFGSKLYEIDLKIRHETRNLEVIFAVSIFV